MASKQASLWSDLPSELLGLVLHRLDSFADRVCVAAVCKPWRYGARLQYHQLPSPMPWIALSDKSYLDVVNKTVHRLKKLTVPHDANCCGSVDNLVFLTRGGGGCFLADPFSGAVLPVTDLAFFLKQQTREEMLSLNYNPSLSIKKVVVHLPQGSSAAEPIIAALITDSRDMNKNTVFVCRAGTSMGVGEKNYPSMSVDISSVLDIAFFRGNLYALSTSGQLFAVEILLLGSSGNPVITNVNNLHTFESLFGDEDEDEMYDLIGIPIHAIDDEKRAEMLRLIGYKEGVYLVESGDQLLKVKRWVVKGETDRFTVYEADFGCAPLDWDRVRSLRGCALFLGRYGCSSKSVPVRDGHYGAQEDCIYFAHHSGDSCIYNVKSGKMMGPLVPDTVVPQQRRRQPWIPTWVFPDQTACNSAT